MPVRVSFSVMAPLPISSSLRAWSMVMVLFSLCASARGENAAKAASASFHVLDRMSFTSISEPDAGADRREQRSPLLAARLARAYPDHRVAAANRRDVYRAGELTARALDGD